MASRRLVRQAAVQLLYARFASPKDQGGPEFWRPRQRQGRTRLRSRHASKFYTHFQQGREVLTEKLRQVLTEYVSCYSRS